MAPKLSQEKALLSLVQGVDGKDWASRRRGWSSSAEEPACMWDGIICDPATNTVQSIRFQSADLYTSIPSEFGSLTNLRTLVLRENLLHGTIPPAVAALPNLQTFDVAENEVSGSVPHFASSSLAVFDASRNKLTGSLPDNIGENHQALTLFDVMANDITGTIPSSFSLMKNLGTLSLTENNFWGLIPPSLGDIPMLMYLYLNDNNLVGPIPPSIARPRSGQAGGSLLSEIWLHENMLSGTIPAAFADLKKLVNFYIDGNKLTGKVPRDICNENLNADFFANVPADAERELCDSVACPVNEVAFEGVYPCKKCDSLHYNPYLGRTGECIALNQRLIMEKFYQSTTKLGPWTGGSNWDNEETSLCDFDGVSCDGNNNVVEINLKGRGLTGTIPEEIGFLEYLEILDLSDNDITGFLPSDLRWAPLRHLDVSGNKIKSIVPPKLCLNQGVNGNGINGDYNCDKIACPAGHFSPIGRQGNAAVGELCIPCVDDDAIYLGRKLCTKLSVRSQSSNENGSLGASAFAGVVVVFVAIAVAAVFFVAFQAHRRRKYAKRAAHPQDGTEDEIVFEKSMYNCTGASSLPYSDDADGAPQASWRDLANRLPEGSYRDEVPGKKPSEHFSIGRVGDSDDDDGRSREGENGYKDEESVSSALGKEVRRQKNHGTSTQVWDYPDPLEDSKSVASSAWTTSKDSHKEVWLDVPKI